VTIKDPEIMEALRAEPELLAFADALQSARPQLEQAVPVRRAHSRRFRVSAVALAAAAALILVLVPPWESGGPSLVDRALAAVGNRPVLHTVIRFTIGVRIDLRTGRSAPLSRDGEVWYDRERHVFRSVARIDGRVVYRAVGTTGSLGSDDPTLYATLYLRALKEGKVRRVGEAVVRGRRVIVLNARGPGGVSRASLDVRTFALVRLQFFQGGRLQSQLDVLKLETLTRKQAHLPRSAPKLDSGSGSLSSGSSATLTGSSDLAQLREAGRVFGRSPLWAGRTIDGRELSSVQMEKTTETRAGRTVRGLVLHLGYGAASESGSDPFLGIDEAPAAPAARLWSVEGDYAPPAGYLDLRSGQTSSGPHSERTEWTGLMRKAGFYLRLTSRSQQTLLSAARALRAAALR
jgi:hypothetical protein